MYNVTFCVLVCVVEQLTAPLSTHSPDGEKAGLTYALLLITSVGFYHFLGSHEKLISC